MTTASSVHISAVAGLISANLPMRCDQVLATHTGQANYFRFRLSPDVSISLGARAKLPGEAMAGEQIEFVVRQSLVDEMTPYERLLSDALRGDPTLFVREAGVEAAWRVVDPVLGAATPVCEYDPNTWGPVEEMQRLAEHSLCSLDLVGFSDRLQGPMMDLRSQTTHLLSAVP
jgi:glucose-6-phosphate 1-dehydrogenase